MLAQFSAFKKPKIGLSERKNEEFYLFPARRKGPPERKGHEEGVISMQSR